ncbi:YetF domain-containing protein [Brachybacterium sp. GCM10030267]|uniref:YetF domain-containing protein n=1 Tax=unclassified Brachybacterium TaxID=2623841 RepID=UPI0036068106
MEFLHQLWTQVGITGSGLLGVLISTAVLYVLYALILQIGGQRLTANPSVLSFSVMALLGALLARAMLGESPTLAGGLVAVATLLLLEFTLGRLRSGLARTFALHGPQASVVMIHGHVLPWRLRHLGVQEEQLLTLLRRAGLHCVQDADLVILEPRGALTIVRRGESIDRRLVQDVRGADSIPRSLLHEETGG